MAIGQFLNPSGKKIDDEFEEIVERIAKAYSTGDGIYKTDEEDVVILRASYSEVF